MLPAMLAAARSAGQPLSLVMLDLDHFKRFNDQHGHLAGDDVLRTAARVISAALCPSDFAVRYGGEEMLVLLPGTCAMLAMVVAERLCQRLRQAVIFDDMRAPMSHLTGSFGVAVLEARMDELQLVAAADAALYRAKKAGRDRVALTLDKPAPEKPGSDLGFEKLRSDPEKLRSDPGFGETAEHGRTVWRSPPTGYL